MDAIEWITFLSSGAVAGWLASLVFKGGSSGLIRNIILGIVGAYVGRFVFKTFEISFDVGNPLANNILVAAAGAAIIIVISRFLSR